MPSHAADDHCGIPRDANGTPIFFLLPPDEQAFYDRWMKACKRGWQATGDPLAVLEAGTWTHLYRQPIPAWLHEGMWVVGIKHRGKKHATRAHNAALRLRRYEAVRDAHDSGLSWDDAYQRAAEVLASTPWAAEARTMKAAYIQVKNDLKSGRGGLYFIPKWHRDFRPEELRKKLGPIPEPPFGSKK